MTASYTSTAHICPKPRPASRSSTADFCSPTASMRSPACSAGKLIDFDGHAPRLERSLGELDMTPPIGRDDLLPSTANWWSANGLDEGMIYLQITRGSAGDATSPIRRLTCREQSFSSLRRKSSRARKLPNGAGG